MTYLDMHNIVLSEADIYVQMGFSAIKTMIWMTEAIHQYQVLTGISRCVQDLELDADSDDGKYSLDDDIDIIEKVDYYASAGAVALPVNIFDYDDFFRLVQQGSINPNVTGGFTAAQSPPFAFSNSQTNIILNGDLPSPYYITKYGACNLFFYPGSGVEGFLRIYYQPYMTPYSPTAKGRWAKFGTPPDKLMETEQIPREFQAALEGIKGYCMMHVLPKIPNHARIYPGAWDRYQRDFQNGVELILRRNPTIGLQQQPTPNMTGRLI